MSKITINITTKCYYSRCPFTSLTAKSVSEVEPCIKDELMMSILVCVYVNVSVFTAQYVGGAVIYHMSIPQVEVRGGR